MKAIPNLFDAVYRHTFAREQQFGWRSNLVVRNAIVGARRFVLDDDMSRFLADLANVALVQKSAVRASVRHQFVEQLRLSARSPHKSVWIEYNLREEIIRSNELFLSKGMRPNATLADPREAPEREGWLIRQHPHIETAFDLHVFVAAPEQPDEHGNTIWSFPFTYAWTTDGSPLPWREIVMPITAGGKNFTSEIYLGVAGYQSKQIAVVQSDLVALPDEMMRETVTRSKIINLIKEFGGVIRRAWALLATINDLPLGFRDVRQAKGFMARGNYRRFLDHRVITLNIPKTRDPHKVARNVVSLMRRRAHQVRGHWRRDWRLPGISTCEHVWTEEGRCERCGGHRVWVHEHQRGDASMGFVTHDYTIKHETENNE